MNDESNWGIFKDEPSMAHSEQGVGLRHRTMHLHKGAEACHLVLVHKQQRVGQHHTSSPGKEKISTGLCYITI